MNYIKATLKDKIFQDLITAKADIQTREMVDQKWYPNEIEELDKKIKERSDWLRANCDNIPISNWMACKDKLPAHGETVLTYTPLTETSSEQFRLIKYGTLKSGFPDGITHWQRIDKPTCY